ncbi:MAG: hypothetical protein GX912_10510, partial [Gammaproteobacteria bacterium]|nr:hypothetical protein [Gammaproteobacteria bacterium]
LTVTTGAKIGGWTVNENSLSISTEEGSKILVEPSGTRFLRINDTSNELMAIRADGVTGLRIYTQNITGKCLTMNAQTGGTAIESYGSHLLAQRGGERWNAPGVLWAGRVSATGGIQSYWGNGCKVTSAQRTSTGNYRVNHNLYHTDYYVQITCTPYSTNASYWAFAMMAGKYSTYFDYQIIDPGSGARDVVVEICIIGRNVF